MAESHFLRALASREKKADAPVCSLTLARTDTILATAVQLAGDSATRKRGLLGRDHLAPETALIIAPCSAIHTFGMRFPIDVIFTERDGRVTRIARDLGPRRFAVSWGAFAAIEMAAGEAARHGVSVGDYVAVKTERRAGL